MKSFMSAAVLALFAAAASGAVIAKEARSDEIAKRSVTHLYVCTNINFTGRCQNLASNTGQCYPLANGFNDAVSSLGPDKGTTCTLWEDINCSGFSLGGIVNPGIFNLNDYGWNDRASSYKCN